MITLFGRYRCMWLPFGLKVSSEFFQKRPHHAVDDLEGIVCIADDMIVAGCGDIQEEANKDHDITLKKLQQRCTERNIRLNKEKNDLRKSQIIFHGHKITKEGIMPDQLKVEANLKMPEPTDIPGVRRLCIMVQYPFWYIPNLANSLEPLHVRTRKGVEWSWTDV